MFYVGLDIHARHITICVLDSQGRVYRRCQVRRIDQMIVCVEARAGEVVGYGGPGDVHPSLFSESEIVDAAQILIVLNLAYQGYDHVLAFAERHNVDVWMFLDEFLVIRS